METTYHTENTVRKPAILEVIAPHVALRRAGKEFVGKCPLHDDSTASFYVNNERGLFHCFGCQAGGDVIRFIELAEKVSFTEALSILGIAEEAKPRPVITSKQRQAAALAAAWMAEQRYKVNVLLGDVLEKIELADEIGDSELGESFIREQSFLRDLYEDLAIARYASDFLLLKDSIEQITEATA